MEKIVIIINGNGGVGKDTLCDLAGERYKVTKISAITPIKGIARQCGWKGEKDPKSRKLLADLKKIFIEYNDLPYQYLIGEYKKFLYNNTQILFVHIREGEEINKFKQYVKIPCVTLLIRRDNFLKNWGNDSDDNVENYMYDYIYNNNKTLTEARNDFAFFLQEVLVCTLKKRVLTKCEDSNNGLFPNDRFASVISDLDSQNIRLLQRGV